MITTAILYVIYGVLFIVTSPIRLLSDVSTVSGFSTGVASASNYLHGLNNFLPITALLSALGVIIAYELAYFTFKLIYWVIKRIPTQS